MRHGFEQPAFQSYSNSSNSTSTGAPLIKIDLEAGDIYNLWRLFDRSNSNNNSDSHIDSDNKDKTKEKDKDKVASEAEAEAYKAREDWTSIYFHLGLFHSIQDEWTKEFNGLNQALSHEMERHGTYSLSI